MGYDTIRCLRQAFCDEDFDLVITNSFDFMEQTLHVSGTYAPCTQAADGGSHQTHFACATCIATNDLTSTMFGKVYQMKYLAGRARASGHVTLRVGFLSCHLHHMDFLHT